MIYSKNSNQLSNLVAHQAGAYPGIYVSLSGYEYFYSPRPPTPLEVMLIHHSSIKVAGTNISPLG